MLTRPYSASEVVAETEAGLDTDAVSEPERGLGLGLETDTEAGMGAELIECP